MPFQPRNMESPLQAEITANDACACSTPKRNLPLLPVELFSEILVNLHDGSSKADLTSCSLVSKTWRKFALELLFSELSLGFYDDSIEEIPTDGQITCPYNPTLSIFLAFLKSVPYITPSIRSLTLICREYDVEEDLDLEYHHYVAHDTLLSILLQLPQLRVVHLCDVLLAGPIPAVCDTLQATGHTPLTVDEVRLNYRELSGAGFRLDELMSPLHFFGCVDTLFLQNMALNVAHQLDLPLKLRIRRLMVEEVDSFGLLVDSLGPTQMLQDLRSLDTGYLSEEDLACMQPLLNDVGTNLTHFSCVFASEHVRMRGDTVVQDIDPYEHPLFDVLNLSHCHNLESLDFHFALFGGQTASHESRNIKQWSCAIRMLSYLHPDATSSPLTISFTIDSTPLGNGIIAEHLLTLWPKFHDVEDELLRLAKARKVIKVTISIRRWGALVRDDYAPHIFPRLRIVNGVLVV